MVLKKCPCNLLKGEEKKGEKEERRRNDKETIEVERVNSKLNPDRGKKDTHKFSGRSKKMAHRRSRKH